MEGEAYQKNTYHKIPMFCALFKDSLWLEGTENEAKLIPCDKGTSICLYNIICWISE